MNEETKTQLRTYITDNRSKGVTDPAIKQALLEKGWKENDVDSLLGIVTNERGIPTWMHDAKIMHAILGAGATAFIIGIWLFTTQSSGGVTGTQLFLVANLCNLITAYYAWMKFYRLSPSIWYRLGAGLLILIASLFAIGSTLFFAEDTVKVFSGVSHLLDENIEITAELLIFLILLPAQVAVYLLSLVTLWVVRIRRKKAGMEIPPKALLRSHLYFFIIAAIATAALFSKLSGL